MGWKLHQFSNLSENKAITATKTKHIHFTQFKVNFVVSFVIKMLSNYTVVFVICFLCFRFETVFECWSWHLVQRYSFPFRSSFTVLVSLFFLIDYLNRLHALHTVFTLKTPSASWPWSLINHMFLKCNCLEAWPAVVYIRLNRNHLTSDVSIQRMANWIRTNKNPIKPIVMSNFRKPKLMCIFFF